jgi:hypothetical protein
MREGWIQMATPNSARVQRKSEARRGEAKRDAPQSHLLPHRLSGVPAFPTLLELGSHGPASALRLLLRAIATSAGACSPALPPPRLALLCATLHWKTNNVSLSLFLAFVFLAPSPCFLSALPIWPSAEPSDFPPCVRFSLAIILPPALKPFNFQTDFFEIQIQTVVT